MSEPAPSFYQCQRCTACCQWPGFVKLSDQDISQISQFLNLSEADFINQYTRLNPSRSGLALIDQPNGHCIFLENSSCKIQPVKPTQCKGFPNTWNFPGWKKVCHAFPVFTKPSA